MEVTTMAASAIVPFVSIEEYLHSDPQPDMDYVDGVLEERNLGEADHGDLQSELVTIFRNHRDEWQVKAIVELRVQVAPSSFRVPDVCIMPSTWKRTPIVREAPLLCIEVKSPSFSFARERARAQDYLRMGVSEVWLFDPVKRTAYVLRPDSITEQSEGSLRLPGTPIEINLPKLFAVLDE
jgi:Uma2 family endonuclease